MKHTYLFEEGLWKASGIYTDEKGKECPLEGQATVSHSETTWKISGFMRVLTDPPSEFQNAYEIEPFKSERDITQWSSQNPALGELSGHFTVIDDSILSVYTSRNNEWVGMEYLRQINENYYQNRGVLIKGDVKISSWAVDLQR